MIKRGTNKRSGSVLVGAMIFVMMIAIGLVSYLLLVQNSDQTVARAQQWNSALPIAEAGVEEAMACLNSVTFTTNQSATNFTLPQQSLNGGYYNVSIAVTNVVTNVITSRGSVYAPITKDLISRTVQVTAQRQGLFTKGIISMTDITMNGNGIATDSWNSHDPTQSSNGIYNGYVGTNGDVAAVDGFVDLGNHTIDGNLWLGPNSTFSGGSVAGTIYTDFHMQFTDSPLPTPTDINGNIIPWSPAPGNTSTHDFTNSGYYIINDNGKIIVEPGITVTLDVRQSSYSPSALTINGGTTNAGTVIMYQESGSLNLGGNAAGGAINNRPANFVYFGMSGVTSVTLGGSSDFVGVIYAPEADMTLNGGGSGNNIMGSLIVHSITMNGHYDIHYDTSLQGYYYGYDVVGSWQEL
jgi:hypothetical protein